LKSLAFSVTDRCNITCDFCAPGCGPHVHGNLSAATMIMVFGSLQRVAPIPLVVFTGGEPTLFLREVLATLQHILENSDTHSRIVTNASWATSLTAARGILRSLKEAGLGELNYSVDDFHQAYVPLTHIGYAVEAALEFEIPVLLAHKSYPGSRSSRATYEALLRREIPKLEDLLPEEYGKHPLTISSGNTLPIGRGAEKVNPLGWVPPEVTEDRWRGPCNEVLKEIVIAPEGRLSPCCGLVDRSIPYFYAGSVLEQDLLELLEIANKSVLYNWLALGGPSSIMDYIISQDPSIPFLGKYVQNCQICNEIFTDARKTEVALGGLEAMAGTLSIQRCLYEAQRSLVIEKWQEQDVK